MAGLLLQAPSVTCPLSNALIGVREGVWVAERVDVGEAEGVKVEVGDNVAVVESVGDRAVV
jgi:hypothetical protein